MIDQILFLLPAFLVGMIVIISHIPLGIEVFKRGIIFIDLAIAQAAALGFVISQYFFHDSQYYFQDQLFAFLIAIIAALLLGFCDKKWPKNQEAIIGSFFIFCASILMILLANNPHGAEHFNNILAGQILWASYRDFLSLTLFYLPILFIWFRHRNLFERTGFYLLFALVITASVQIIGIYLVFSFLILPAFIANFFSKYHQKIIYSYSVAMIALICGLFLSFVVDFPTGPIICLPF